MLMKSEIIKEYLEKYPELPTLTLAKLIYKENPSVFTDVENCRYMIRYNRGASGKKNNEALKDRRFVRDIRQPYNPHKMPESDEREFLPFVIPNQFKNVLVFGDVHIPYHSVDSLNIMIDFAIKKGVDSILLNGDIIDFHQLSSFVKDPRKRSFSQELKILNEFLDRLDEIFGVKIFYKIGNHEERFENYLRVKAPELIGQSEFNLDILCRFGERNITVIKDKRTIQFSKLNILHGHELKGSIIPPVNAARGVFLRTKSPTLVNHFHTKTAHGESTLNDKYIECWSVGCMCELHPEYAVNNRWIHGFAIVERFEDNSFAVNNYKIIKGRVYK